MSVWKSIMKLIDYSASILDLSRSKTSGDNCRFNQIKLEHGKMKSIRKNLVVWTATASVLTLQACHLSCIDIWLKGVYGSIKIGLTLSLQGWISSFVGFQGQEGFSTHHTIGKERCIYGSGTGLWVRSMKSNSSFAMGL